MRTGFAREAEPFVDRVELMGELRALLTDVTEGRKGQALVVTGPSGIGKTAVFRKFQEEVAQVWPPGACRVVSVRCQPVIGQGVARGVASDVLELLQASKDGRGDVILRKTGDVLARGAVNAAPQLLLSLVPGLGPVVTLAAGIAQAMLAGVTPSDSALPSSSGVAEEICRNLLERVQQGPPVLLLIDDVQDCDLSSLAILHRLLDRLPGGLGVVLSFSTDSMNDDTSRPSVEPLLERWEDDGLVRRRSLEGLPREAVGDLVRMKLDDPPLSLPQELYEGTGGDPGFLVMFLEALGRESGSEAAMLSDLMENLPGDRERLAERRLGSLSDDERELVRIGAAQGEVFLSRSVAEVMDWPHDDVARFLAREAGRGGLIKKANEEALPKWIDLDDLDGSDCYQFENRALWRLVYGEQSRYQKLSRHSAIADALTYGQLTAMPLERRLEIARHLRLAGTKRLLESARAHYDLARDAAIGGSPASGLDGQPTVGLSVAEAEQHCKKAIDAIDRLRAGDVRGDRLYIETVELLLSLTEVRWRGQVQSENEPPVDVLAAEAEKRAERYRDPGLMIRTTLLRGKTLLATQGLLPSLDKLGEAVRMAEAHEDPVTLFVARVEHGRQLSKRRLADGLAELRRAEEMYRTDPRLAEEGNPLLQYARNLGEMQLGISLFDSGDLGEALVRLQRCVKRLRAEPLRAELPIALNYLAQVHLGLGSFEDADKVLREALKFEETRGGDSGWHAYNKALLAHHLVEGPAREEALRMAAKAWQETIRTWLANLVPIVRNLYVETLLLAADGSQELLEQADRLAVDTLRETEQSGMVRSEIAAYCLRSRILTRMGNHETAQEQARTAVRILTEVGDMPALRSEEVYYHAAVVLAGRGEGSEALELLERARQEVSRKAATIPDEALRDQFLTRVSLNEAIWQGVGIES